jgi:hypothetical protein
MSPRHLRESVPDNVRFAVADKDAGFMAKLLEVIVNYLRNRSF